MPPSVESTPIVSAFLRTSRPNPPRSPAAHAADRPGKAASAIDTPSSDTGTLWKLRANETAETLPATSVVATAVKNRNVSGSMGWLIILGSISPRNSRSAGMRRSRRGRMRTVVCRMPTTRMPRCRQAPITAPTAAALIPSLSWSSSVPPAMPRLYRIGASA